MKSIAFSKLSNEYQDAEVTYEEPISNSNGITRRPDVLVSFPTERYPYGKGIAVEVQYRNYSKDLNKTEKDYFDLGYSVLWLYERHFDDHDVRVSHVRAVWPNAVPHSREASREIQSFEQPGSKGAVELTVPLPQKFLDELKPQLKDAYNTGRKQFTNQAEADNSTGTADISFDDLVPISTSISPVEKIWLSQRGAYYLKSLDLLRVGRGRYALQLAKGKRGEAPETVRLPLSQKAAERLSTIPTAIKPIAQLTRTDGAWDELRKISFRPSSEGVSGEIVLVVPPGNDGLILQFKRTGNGETTNLGAKFRPSQEVRLELTEFFEQVSQFVEDS